VTAPRRIAACRSAPSVPAAAPAPAAPQRRAGRALPLSLSHRGHASAQVAQQQQEWAALHASAAASAAPGAAPPSRADFFWALAAVRSRTFSGPYVASTLQDRLRLAGLVAFLGVGNVLLQGPDGIEKSAGAAVAVFVFNILYEVILSQKLRQYAMCPVIDLANHSSSGTVGGGAAERGGAGAWCGRGR
jgi:hypothetical protein